MVRLKYSEKIEGGWSVGTWLAYRLGFLRALLGSWFAVSSETGVALSTIRRIRHHLVREPLDRFITIATYERIEKAFFRYRRSYLLKSRKVERLTPFVPRLM